MISKCVWRIHEGESGKRTFLIIRNINRELHVRLEARVEAPGCVGRGVRGEVRAGCSERGLRDGVRQAEAVFLKKHAMSVGTVRSGRIGCRERM